MAERTSDTTVLAGYLLDGTGAPVQRRVSIQIADGLIESIESADASPADRSSQVVDLRGAWVMPGLIDAHMHLWGLSPGEVSPADFETRLASARQQAKALLHAGFTTVRDLGSPITPRIRDSTSTHRPTAPRILAAHVGLTGARGPWLIPQPSWWEARVVRGSCVSAGRGAAAA